MGNYVADFYCASRMLVVELDGDSHYNERAQRYDESRTVALNAEGIRVVRVTNTEVMQDFEGVCAMILRILDAKA